VDLLICRRGRRTLCARFRAAVDAWRPDVVFLTHGFALKPYLARALAHHRLVGRFYAHELACARDALRFKDELTAHLLCLREDARILGLEDDLNDAFPVAQVYKNNTAVVTARMHPTAQRQAFSDML